MDERGTLTEIVNLRFTQAMFDRIKAAAASDRRTVAQWIRIALATELDKRSVTDGSQTKTAAI